jgi:hypothetical protein
MGQTETSDLLDVLEGTWEEIARQASRLAGKRLRVQILENGHAEGEASARLFYATATREERVRALREYAASHHCEAPVLSGEAISQESIYFGEE